MPNRNKTGSMKNNNIENNSTILKYKNSNWKKIIKNWTIKNTSLRKICKKQKAN
jgi:hypothetical protein